MQPLLTVIHCVCKSLTLGLEGTWSNFCVLLLHHADVGHTHWNLFLHGSYVLCPGNRFLGQKRWLLVVRCGSNVQFADCTLCTADANWPSLIMFDLMVVTDVIQKPSKHDIDDVAFTFKAFGFLWVDRHRSIDSQPRVIHSRSIDSQFWATLLTRCLWQVCRLWTHALLLGDGLPYYPLTMLLSFWIPLSLSQVVFARKLLVVIVSVWFPPSTSMTTRTIILAVIVFVSTVLSCDCCPSLFYQTHD